GISKKNLTLPCTLVPTHPPRLRISSSLTESGLRHLANQRGGKRQPTYSSSEAVRLLLQVRRSARDTFPRTVPVIPRHLRPNYSPCDTPPRHRSSLVIEKVSFKGKCQEGITLAVRFVAVVTSERPSDQTSSGLRLSRQSTPVRFPAHVRNSLDSSGL